MFIVFKPSTTMRFTTHHVTFENDDAASDIMSFFSRSPSAKVTNDVQTRRSLLQEAAVRLEEQQRQYLCGCHKETIQTLFCDGEKHF